MADAVRPSVCPPAPSTFYRSTVSPSGPDSGNPVDASSDLEPRADESTVPAAVATFASGDPICLVWRNDLGGRTYRVDRADRTEYVKWAPDHPEIDLELEALKLVWAGRYITVPRVLDHGRDGESAGWLHTVGIPATSAVAPRWKAEPRRAARAIGAGLRTLHDRLPVSECPWSWRASATEPPGSPSLTTKS